MLSVYPVGREASVAPGVACCSLLYRVEDGEIRNLVGYRGAAFRELVLYFVKKESVKSRRKVASTI